MTTINQKEYLKKYLSLGSEPGKKKKRKKKSTSTSDRVKIIDDDVDIVAFNQAVEEDLHAQNEDAPQIVGVIDDRPLELRISDYRDTDLWKPVGEEHTAEIRNRMQNQTAPVTEKTSRKILDKAESIPDKYNDDYSPPRRKVSRFDRRSSSMQRDLTGKGSMDVSPKKYIKDNDRSPVQKVTTDNDASPPRRVRRHSDASPVRRYQRGRDDASPLRKNRRDSDNSPSRISKTKSRWSDTIKYKVKDDRSPARRYRKDRNSSPSRKGRYRPERSSVERTRKDYESSSSKRTRRASDISPLGKDRKDSDPLSPDRRNYRNVSPPSKNREDSDASPARRNRRNASMESRGQIDRHIIPIKSKKGNDHRHVTSPRMALNEKRKERDDSSRRQMSRLDDHNTQSRGYSVEDGRNRDKSNRHNEDDRKGVRYDSNKSSERRYSPNPILRNVDRRDDAASSSSRSARLPRDQEPSQRTSPDLQPPTSRHSNKSGLQRANDIIMGKDPFTQSFDDLSTVASSSGNTAPIYRDRRTGKVRDFKREAEEARQKQEKEDELKAKYAKWGRGLKQVEDATEKLNSDLHEMNKPLARYADDEDLERHLKEMEREGDPMLQYLRKKRQKQDIEAGKPSKPKFEGEFMPNRYAIRPGHRWDGVDRSNGYEKKWFEIMNSRRARQEDAYKWSTEDM